MAKKKIEEIHEVETADVEIDSVMEETPISVKEKTPKVAVPIIRGRMPIAVVYVIKFGVNKDLSIPELSTMYGTTSGKISDIKKNYNFQYLKEDFKPSLEQKTEAIDYLKKHPNFGSDDTPCAALIDEIDELLDATPEEAKAFLDLRASFRGQNSKTKSGETADAGGGNRRKSAKKKPVEEDEPVTDTSADDLLS